MIAQIQADGSQPFELDRTRSLQYSIFNLNGLFKLAHIGGHVGMDLWNYKTPKGVGLRNALDYLIPYVLNIQQWPYKQIAQLDTHDFKDAADLLYQAAVKYHDRSYLQSCNSIIQEKGISKTINNLSYGTPSVAEISAL